MAIERKWPEVGPFYLVAPGTSSGRLTILNTTGLHVKQKIQLNTVTPMIKNMGLEIKRIVGPDTVDTNATMTIEVGLPGTSITNRVDVSSYLSGAAYILAPEQTRPDIPLNEVSRAIYDEEPVMAQRVLPVDPNGNYLTPNNPLPTALFGQQITILNNILTMQIQSQGSSPVMTPSTYLINNEGFFVFDNEGNFIEAD